jgi:hypothetical protein
MRLAPKGLIVLAIAALLSVPAFADDTAAPAKSTTPEPSAQTTTAQTPTEAPKPADTTPKPAPSGPLSIKVSDTVNFRFGVLLQPQADFSQNAAGGTAENLMLRRTRFIASGQIAKPLFFFFQTENSRLGGAIGTAAKVISSGFQTVDAVAEYRYSKPLNLWVGLIYLPTSRDALTSSSSEFMIDVNSYAYTATTALAGTGGRDTGFLLRGYAMADKLEYRVGAFQGLREAGSRNPFRKIARLQYELFDTEPYAFPSYPGSYFGTKKIVAIGAAYDEQHNYKAPTADIHFDVPTSFGSAISTVTWMQLNGSTTVTALPKSTIFVADGGIFMKGSKLGPWLRFEDRSFAAPRKSLSEKRYLVGVNWYPMGNNLNVKSALGYLQPEVGRKQKQLTLQLQFFIY